MVMKSLLERTPEGIRVHNFSLEQVNAGLITLSHIRAAVAYVPGARLAPDGLDAVEVYDPASGTWRVVITFEGGMAWVDHEAIANRRGPAYHVAAQLARLLDACFVTEDGLVLVCGEAA
jgi:hypothetical protein